MGNQASSPFASAIAEQQKQLLSRANIPKPEVQPVPDVNSEIAKLRIELNMAKNDVRSKQDQYDKLVPEEANERKTFEAKKLLDAYVLAKDEQFNNELKLYNVILEQVDTLANNGAVDFAKKYQKELEKKEALVYAKHAENKEKAFTHRRRFLDSDPQKPIGGFFNFQSTDSQIMLAFWISYVLMIGTISIIVIYKYGAYLGSAKNVAILMTLAIFIMIMIAHSIIQAVATR